MQELFPTDKQFVDAVVDIVTHMIANYDMKIGNEKEKRQQERALMEQKLDIAVGLINLYLRDCECLQSEEVIAVLQELFPEIVQTIKNDLNKVN